MIMDVIMHHPEKRNGWTAREVRSQILEDNIMAMNECLSSSISARINGLKKLGYLWEIGTRPCEVSGKTAIANVLDMGRYRDFINMDV